MGVRQTLMSPLPQATASEFGSLAHSVTAPYVRFSDYNGRSRSGASVTAMQIELLNPGLLAF